MRMVKLKNNLCLILVIHLLSFFSLSCSGDYMEAISGIPNDCVWSESPHCAFTDLIEYKGKVYCCFREGAGHIPSTKSEFGKIRIIVTEDGESWGNIGVISDPEFDLRDPKFSITPDNRLMLNCGRYTLDGIDHTVTIVKFISDEELDEGHINSNDFYPISIDNNPEFSKYWLWKIKWINDEAYGIAYSTNGTYPILVKSTDGINYTKITELGVLGNEADIELLPNGQMLIIIRAQNGNGFIGLSSSYPYKDWNWFEASHLIHCPAILSFNDKTYVAGRGIWGTMLFKYLDHNIKPLILLPIGGIDNAYPGIILKDNQLWISYYGEYRGNVAIYVSKVPLERIMDE